MTYLIIRKEKRKQLIWLVSHSSRRNSDQLLHFSNSRGWFLCLASISFVPRAFCRVLACFFPAFLLFRPSPGVILPWRKKGFPRASSQPRSGLLPALHQVAVERPRSRVHPHFRFDALWPLPQKLKRVPSCRFSSAFMEHSNSMAGSSPVHPDIFVAVRGRGGGRG